MPTNDSRIQGALLHPEAEVRRIALAFYAKSFTQDEALLPLVLTAARQHGRGQPGYLLLHEAKPLPHTPATVTWLVEELGQAWDCTTPGQDNYCLGLAELLNQAPPVWLKGEMAELASFPEELRQPFRERLAMAAWDWDTAWQALRQLFEASNGGVEMSWPQLDRAECLFEVLARHREQAPTVLQGLQQHCAVESPSLRGMLEQSLINVAGRMRLVEAIPLLMAQLEEDDLELYEESMASLPRIGGKATVATLAARWPQANLDFRIGAAEVLEHLHTPAALALCEKFFQESEEPELTYALAHALLGQCAEEALEPVREYVGQPGPDDSVEEEDLRYHLVATATILGASFPEYDRWYEEAVESHWGWPSQPPKRLRNRLRVEYGLDPIDADWDSSHEDDLYDPDWDELFSPDEGKRIAALRQRLGELDPALLDEFDQQMSEDLELSSDAQEGSGSEPLHRDVFQVGRNDPCPCGSGKKYKKCCLHKRP